MKIIRNDMVDQQRRALTVTAVDLSTKRRRHTMKRVKIEIEIEVPDDCAKVTVNKGGAVIGFGSNAKPEAMNGFWQTVTGKWWYPDVLNWRESLTEVNGD